MDSKRPLTQQELEGIINDPSFYDDDDTYVQSASETFSSNKKTTFLLSLETTNKEYCCDDELLAAAQEIEECLFTLKGNDIANASARESTDVSKAIVTPSKAAIKKGKSLAVLSVAHPDQMVEILTETEEQLESDKDESYVPDEEENTDSSVEQNEMEANEVRELDAEETLTSVTTPSERNKGKQSDIRKRYKYNREKGKEYKGYKKENGKFVPVVDRQKRTMLPKCNSKVCITAKNRHCSEFDDKFRRKLFDKFWSLTWDMKKTYVSTLVSIKKTKRPAADQSRRTLTFEYFLKKDKIALQVCKKTFLNTLGLREFMVRNWCLKAESGMHVGTDDIEMPLRKRISNERAASIQSLTDFFNAIPKLESHYCRASTTKLYVEPIYQNKMDLYRVYKIFCLDKKVKPVAASRFKKQMIKHNIAIHAPKKDQCDVCVGYKAGNIEDTVYQLHIQRKTDAREAKAEDKKVGQESPGEIAVMTMDVQAVKLAPFLQASAIYFKTKLCVHNFTIFDLVTKDCHCYLWHEAEGGLEANIFSTIIFKHLENYLKLHPRTKQIILYSDGCGYQNRNNCLANTLLHLATTKNIIIEQKFLEKGHTQMEVDSAHSLIERKLKNQVIYLPSDYIKFCELARPSQPFNVHYLSHDYFLNFNNVTYYNSIRPGIRRLDPVIADIRCLQYGNFDGNDEIRYKLNYADDYKVLLNKSNKNTKEISRLYKRMLNIKQEKWNHFQTLKAVLPKDTHHFYDSLTYK